MIDFVQTYIDDFKEFLPKTYVSSPISKAVKDKLIEVMPKEIKEFISYDSDGKLLDTSIIVDSKAPVDLGLLPEVLEVIGCDFTYYKWEKVSSVHELTLYKNKPRRDSRYQLSLGIFVGGYILSILLAVACMGFLYYFFYLLSVNSVQPEEVVVPPLWFWVFSMLFMTILMIVFFVDIYIYLFRKTLVAQFLSRDIYFGNIETIDRPSVRT